MRRHFLLHRPLALAVAGLTLTFFTVVGCDLTGTDTDADEDVGTVAVGFTTTSTPESETNLSPKAEGDSMVVTGSNGELIIDDVRLIVSELELEADTDSADFEPSPTFLDLPLDTSEVAPVAATEVPTGTYTDLNFKVEDVELDEADEDEDVFADLADTIREEFSDWPDSGSMVVTGTFTPANDTSREFTTYFDAEMDVEQDLNPALDVTDNNLSRSLTIKIDPAQWFENADGTVRNLARDDYESTGEVVEFGDDFEDGIVEIEADDDDDLEDDN